MTLVMDHFCMCMMGQKKAKETRKWLGQEFDISHHEGLLLVTEGWECEYDSLIMIDALLKYLGLEIDKDEESLDKPLRQIGDGIDARCFGTHVGLDEDSDLEGNASDMEENNF